MTICTSQDCSVSRILNVKEKLGLQQQVFPIFSMTAISKRKNIFIVDALGLREINMALAQIIKSLNVFVFAFSSRIFDYQNIKVKMTH